MASSAQCLLRSVFVPGFLLLIELPPFWERFRSTITQSANAAVVGILASVLFYRFFSAVGKMRDFTLALLCFVLCWRESSRRGSPSLWQ